MLNNDWQYTLEGTSMQHESHMGKRNQNELMAEIYSKSLVSATGKILLIKLS